MFAGGHVPDAFERDMACTEADWLRWLPDAVGAQPWTRDGARVRIALGEGALHIDWRAEAPRRVALIRLPRLCVRFAFEGVSPEERARFMQRFDLHMQRGGG